MTDPALRRLVRRHWRHRRHGASGIGRSVVKPLLVREVWRLMPGARADDLRRHGCGVRTQAVDGAGTLVDDFVITTTATRRARPQRPSSAATSSLLIGRRIAQDILGLLVVPPVVRSER